MAQTFLLQIFFTLSTQYLQMINRRLSAKIISLFICIHVCSAQFTWYVPDYTMSLPQEPMQYGSFPYVNAFDPYFSQIKSSDAPNPPTPTNPPPLNPPTRQSSGGCSPPLTNVGGVCRCPDNGILLSGRCFRRDSGPTIVCSPPRINLNNECVCPDGEVFKDGFCVISRNIRNTVNEPTSDFGFGSNVEPSTTTGGCASPRIFINGRCSCPDNQIFLSGQCYRRDTGIYPTQPISPIPESDSVEALAKIFRSYNGEKNNLNYPSWGSKGSTLERRVPNQYLDGISRPDNTLPNPREISNQVGHIDGPIPRSRNNITMAFVIWGQFMDHDIDLTEAGSTEDFNIDIPPNDQFFQANTRINFKRSHTKPSPPGTERKFPNDITAWIDASNVYGSNETQARFLRSFQDGKLRSSRGTENLLPTQSATFGSLFIAGDVRANENIMLTSYHTIFMREHNRMCDVMKRRSPQMNDEMLYQAARMWVIGLLQKITMDDFLPIMLGSRYNDIIGPYSGYKSNVNPNIPTEFSTASFRIGHPLIMETYHMVDRFGNIYQNFTLAEVFFHPSIVTSGRIDDIFRGLAINLMKEKDARMVESVRNLLVLDPENREIKIDLYSLNIQRGRDHGLCSFNNARRAFGLPKLTSFRQLAANQTQATNFQRVYKNRIDDVGLFDGIISEPPAPGAVLGELGCRIVGQVFRNLRDADRFWYEHAYPPSVIREIKSTTFSDVIARNSNTGTLPSDIFHFHG